MINEKQMTLAVDWVGQSSLIGWWASEKLNGCRAVWDGKDLWTREGRRIKAPKWFTKDFPNFMLDGEICAGRGHGVGNNNSAYKVAMTAVVHGGKWFGSHWTDKGIHFTPFDAPNAAGTWIERYATIPKHLSHVPAFRIENPRHLVEYMMTLRRLGAEGAMFRNPDEIGYHAGRTGSLLRWKF